jgi:hypothetical protein
MKRFLLLTFAFLLILPQITFADDPSTYKATFIDNTGTNTETYEIEYDGMVPCGRCLKASDGNPQSGLEKNGNTGFYDCESDEVYVPCTLCHLFIVFDHIISFILGTLVPSLALLVIVFSGVLLITAGLKPDQVNQAKSALVGATIGLFLSYLSWAIIAFTILTFVNTPDPNAAASDPASKGWEMNWSEGGIEINHMCEVEIEKLNPN